MSHDKFKVYHFQLKLIMAQCSCGNSKFRRYLDVDDEEQDCSLLGVVCTSCGQEWLREEYLNKEGEGRLIFAEIELRVNLLLIYVAQLPIRLSAKHRFSC